MPTADEASTARSAGSNDDPGSSGPNQPVCDGWPVPALALVLSGDQRGYIEPCGCTEDQYGGISRRDDLLRQLREEKGWTIAGLDLGGLVRRTRAQSRLKFQTLLNALHDMNYRAVGIGPEELRLGPEELLSQSPHLPGETGIVFAGSNLVFFEDPGLGTPARSTLFTENEITVGVLGVLGETIRRRVIPDGRTGDVSFQAPSEAIAVVLQEFEQQPDLIVLLSQSNVEESRSLAEQFPRIDLILSAGGAEDPDGTPERVGQTMLVTVGRKGKYAGIVGFYPDDPNQRLRFELVRLDRHRFGDSETMIEHMRDYQQVLRDEQLAGREPAVKHPSEATFVGSRQCGECHEHAYEVWKGTPHARAFESLDPTYEHEGYERLKGIARMHDPECLSCHVTGWHPQDMYRYESGFINEEYAQSDAERTMFETLRGSQCENCHGPGSRHIELIHTDPDESSRQVRVTLEQSKKRICNSCHDLDNSPDFEFESYWEQVEHYDPD